MIISISPKLYSPVEVLISCSIRSGYLVSLWATSRLHSGIPRCLQAKCCLLQLCISGEQKDQNRVTIGPWEWSPIARDVGCLRGRICVAGELRLVRVQRPVCIWAKSNGEHWITLNSSELQSFLFAAFLFKICLKYPTFCRKQETSFGGKIQVKKFEKKVEKKLEKLGKNLALPRCLQFHTICRSPIIVRLVIVRLDRLIECRPQLSARRHRRLGLANFEPTRCAKTASLPH